MAMGGGQRDVDDEIRAAIQQLTARALTTRQRFAEFERHTVGHEWSASELMAGFVVDVGDLTRLVMAAEGHRVVDDHEAKLADCLWSVLVLADALQVDLGAAFVGTLGQIDSFLDSRSSESGG